MKKLKLVGAQTYISEATNNTPISTNTVVTVSDEHAAGMLALSYSDSSNNEHFLFVEVDGDGADENVAENDDENADEATEETKTRRRRG